MNKVISVNITPQWNVEYENAKQLFKDGKIKDADILFLKIMNEYKDPMIYYHYAELFKGYDVLKAITAVNDGLYIDANNYNLLKAKADILSNYGDRSKPSSQLLSNLNDALYYIRKAKEQFELGNVETEKMILENRYENSGTVVHYFLTNKMEINGLEINILNQINSVFVWQKVSDTEERLYKERTRLIELLGLFVAIFAFIFASVDVFTKANYTLIDGILLITAMGLVLMSFILGLHLAINPEERMRKLIFMFLILAFILFILPIVPGLIAGLKYYLKLQ